MPYKKTTMFIRKLPICLYISFKRDHMDWINKYQGIITLVIIIALGIWNLCLSIKTDTREESALTKKANDLTAKLEERVSRAQTDLEKANTITAHIDKHLAVIEERLKQATTKTLMAAGITKEQALEYWKIYCDSRKIFILLVPLCGIEPQTY